MCVRNGEVLNNDEPQTARKSERNSHDDGRNNENSMCACMSVVEEGMRRKVNTLNYTNRLWSWYLGVVPLPPLLLLVQHGEHEHLIHTRTQIYDSC